MERIPTTTRTVFYCNSSASAPFAHRRMMVRGLSVLALLTFWTMATPSAHAAEDDRPNVVLIMTDDQGWGDIGSHGNPHLETPHLDSLGNDGARFDRFYVSPVCAPTRAGLLTGRYHLRTGTHGVTRGQENMRGEEVTIAELLRDAGYRTGCFGKWHNGAHYPYHPNGQGFDEFIGFCAGHWNNYFSTGLEHNGDSLESDGYIADYLTTSAIDFIEASSDDAFFCYLSLNTPHSPWQVPDEYFDRYQGLGLDEKAACAYAMCANIDDNVGRLLEALDRLELADSTMVLFLTDNGPNSNRFNGQMRGRKGSVHEGGVRVPLFVRYPDGIKPGTMIESISANIDLLPTIAEMCGVTIPDEIESKLDGKSLAKLLTGESDTFPDRTLFTFRRTGELGAVRTQRWRATLERNGWQLFDMEADPNQETDVADQNPDRLRQMSRIYEQMLREVGAGELEPLPVSIGHEGYDSISIPAHEAFLVPGSGASDDSPGISYKGQAGWANDWITNWTDTDASAFWKIDVVRPGTYQVRLRYCGDESQVGTSLSVSCADRRQTATVTQSHPARFVDSPDRISRGEVYEHVSWGVLSVGELKLEPGNDAIVLRAVNIEGDMAVEIKALELVRIGD